MKLNYREGIYSGVPDEHRTRFLQFLEAQEFASTTIGDQEWIYLDTGAKGADTLLVLTGALKNPVFSFSIIDLFVSEYRIVAPAYPPVSSISELHQGFRSLLTELQIEKVHVIGSSWGGCLAHVFAFEYPDLIRKLILANTGLPNSWLIRTVLKLYVRGLKPIKATKMLSGYRKRVLKLLSDPPEQLPFWEAATEDLMPSLFAFEDYRTLLESQLDYLEFYADRITNARLPVETLIITARNETAGNAKMRKRLKDCFPNLKTHLFDNGGHAPSLLDPDEYRGVVIEFLTS